MSYWWVYYEINGRVLFPKRPEQIINISNPYLLGLMRTNGRVCLKNVLNETCRFVLS